MNKTAKEIYESLSEEFVRKGIGSNRFSELNELFTWASIAENAKSEYEKIQALESKLAKAVEALRFYAEGEIGNDLEIRPEKKELWSIPSQWSQRSMSDHYAGKLARKTLREIGDQE